MLRPGTPSKATSNQAMQKARVILILFLASLGVHRVVKNVVDHFFGLPVEPYMHVQIGECHCQIGGERDGFCLCEPPNRLPNTQCQWTGNLWKCFPFK